MNLIRAGGNYGWPDQLGPGGASKGYVDPVVDFVSEIVPTGCAVWRGDLYFGSFGDGLVRRLNLPPGRAARPEAVARLPGGITDLEVGPGGALYVSTTDAIFRLESPPRAALQTHSPAPPPDIGRGRAIALALIAAGAAGIGLIAVRIRRRAPR